MAARDRNETVSEKGERLEITGLLAAIRQGDATAMDRLLSLVYDDLKRRARRQLGWRRDATLSTTGLVHEAYLRLAATPSPDWQDRHHFFAVASKAMRSVVVDYARRRSAIKRGGLTRTVGLNESVLRVDKETAEVLALNDAVAHLATVDPRLAELVELRFFGGLSVEEIADLLRVSDRTVKRDWSKARTLLHGFLRSAP
jgi:RNA polymerase sigma factor (TIGR02999 family)